MNTRTIPIIKINDTAPRILPMLTASDTVVYNDIIIFVLINVYNNTIIFVNLFVLIKYDE